MTLGSNYFDQFDSTPAALDAPATPAPASPAVAQPAAPAPATPAAAGRHGNFFDQFDSPGDAPIADTGTTQGFADEAPLEASSQLSKEDEAALIKLAQHPDTTADDLRHFAASKGHAIANADEVIAARDKGLGVNGSIAYPLPKPEQPGSAAGATARGMADSITLGFGDEMRGVTDAAAGLLHGKDFADTYHQSVDESRGQMASDEELHAPSRIAGELLGGIVLPVGLEKSGLTASIEAVGLTAGRAALREGSSMSEARVIAQRAITRRLATEGGAYGAAYGAGSADGDPGQRLLAGVGGAATDAALGGGLGLAGEQIAPAIQAGRVAARQAPWSDAVQTAKAAARQDIDILPQDLGSAGVGRATQGAAQTTFGASTVRNAASRLYNSFKDRIGVLAGNDTPSPREAGEIVGGRAQQAADRSVAAADTTSGAIQRSLADPVDATAAGQLLQRGVSRHMDATAERASQLYGQVPIAADQPAQIGSTRQLLNDLTAEWQSNPKLGAIFKSGRLASYLDALTPNVSEADTGLLDASGAPVKRDVTEGGKLNWQDLSEFRTRVGDMLSDPSLSEGIAPRQLRSLYGALSSDMEATARDAGPDAFSKWKRANDYYDGRMKRINDTFSMVLGPKKDMTPNEAFSSLQNMLKPGASGNAAAFGQIMRSIPPADANIVRSTIVNDARGGRTFDPDKLVKVWGNISDRAKAYLLPQPGMSAIMDDAASRASVAGRNPFAGMSGEQIYAALDKMAGSKGDANRFRAQMAGLSPEEANSVRSTFIHQGGLATPGAQNAEGDAFSISRWLTRWNSITPDAKAALFGTGELRASMEDLARVADKVKQSEKLAGHSNTGAVNSFNATTGGLYGAVSALIAGAVSGHPIAGTAAAIAAAAPAAYQRISAEILTSPKLLRWLARVPKTLSPAGEGAYLSRLSKIAAAEPAIAAPLRELEQRLASAVARGSPLPIAAEKPDKSGQVPPQEQSASAHPNDPAYQQWLKTYGIREEPTYDTYAAFKAGLKPSARGHLNDEFKLPNHPTFSDESVHNGENGHFGGKWIQTGGATKAQPDGIWSFKASPWNLQNMSKPALKTYFDHTEPGMTIIFPDGEHYTGRELHHA